MEQSYDNFKTQSSAVSAAILNLVHFLSQGQVMETWGPWLLGWVEACVAPLLSVLQPYNAYTVPNVSTPRIDAWPLVKEMKRTHGSSTVPKAPKEPSPRFLEGASQF